MCLDIYPSPEQPRSYRSRVVKYESPHHDTFYARRAAHTQRRTSGSLVYAYVCLFSPANADIFTAPAFHMFVLFEALS